MQSVSQNKHSSESNSVSGVVPKGNFEDEDASEIKKSDTTRVQPLIGNGDLVEMVNKRSEAANRKYRAFIHFVKNYKGGSSKIGSGKEVDKNGPGGQEDPANKSDKTHKIDDLS